MPQDDDLDREIRVTAADESDELEDAAERPVEEREGHCRMVAAPESRRQSAVRRQWMTFSARTRSQMRMSARLSLCEGPDHRQQQIRYRRILASQRQAP